MKVKRLLFRAFYYFRIGYSIYLSLPVALFGYMTLIYQLFLRDVTALAWLFPRFSVFLIVAATILLPLGGVLGWLHIKRTIAYKSEVDITVEANPYNYKLIAGKEQMLSYPSAILSLQLALKFYKKQGILTPEEEKQLKWFIEQYQALVKGGTLKR